MTFPHSLANSSRGLIVKLNHPFTLALQTVNTGSLNWAVLNLMAYFYMVRRLGSSDHLLAHITACLCTTEPCKVFG